MRKSLILILAASSCVARAQPADVSANPATTQPSATSVPVGATEVPMDDLLDAMEKVGVEMKTLRADVAMTDTNEANGDDSTRTGTIWLQRRGPGDTRGRVLFKDLTANNRLIDEKVEYLLDGDWVIDRVYGRDPNDPAGKRETHRQIRNAGDKTDILKLGEGPFPLPIGQSREAIKDQFEVSKLLPDDEKNPGLVGLNLLPHPNSRLSQTYHNINVWVDPHDAMPRVIETVAANGPDGGAARTTKLSNVKINSDVTDADFKLDPIGPEWTVVTEPLAPPTTKPAS